MGLRAIPFTASQNGIMPNYLGGSDQYFPSTILPSSKLVFAVSAKAKKEDTEEPKEKKKQSLFSSVTEALDFSQVRSAKDAELIDEAREATQSGERMSREQVLIICQ